MPLSLLTRNQLIVAKTRRGKSTLLLHIASHLMERMASGHERMLLVVVDPHQDLAEAVLSQVPAEIEDRVTYLDAANRERPPGLNLLDVALFPNRDRTSENVITMMHRLWPDNWGPRMEGALRACLSCLHEANAGRDRDKQYTLLDVVPMLTSVDFRDEVLKQVPDRALWVWWRDNYDKINRTFQQQTANPVTTKIGRFMITEASRLILGQSRSTLDLRSGDAGRRCPRRQLLRRRARRRRRRADRSDAAQPRRPPGRGAGLGSAERALPPGRPGRRIEHAGRHRLRPDAERARQVRREFRAGDPVARQA